MGIGEGRKILMLCYYFPPLIDVGCKRSVAFAKYLNKHGWIPHVLSVRNPDLHYCVLGNDQPPDGVATSYTRSVFNLTWIFGKINAILVRILACFKVKLKRNYLHDLLSIPDHFVGWIPGAVIRGYSIIKKEQIDYIYISCTPYSSAFAGMALKKLTGKPLIIDFRDSFYVNVPDIFGLPLFRKKINLKLERSIINAADIFIVTTDEIRQGYIREYPEISGKTYTIHNGFDFESLPDIKNEKFTKFTVVYGGNMYFDGCQSRSFFEALYYLKEKGSIDKDDFQFLYFGGDKQKVNEISEHFCLGDLITSESAIPHRDMLNILSKAHLQLLRIIKPMISTKLFEGIALNLPFLATIPDGEVGNLIRLYSPSSYIVTDDSVESIASAILMAINNYRKGLVEDNRIDDFLACFSRESLTRKMEQIIESRLREAEKFPNRTQCI
jgi:glycosyltransferase involved in cell wall biosynthesis